MMNRGNTKSNERDVHHASVTHWLWLAAGSSVVALLVSETRTDSFNPNITIHNVKNNCFYVLADDEMGLIKPENHRWLWVRVTKRNKGSLELLFYMDTPDYNTFIT